jgi:soluble lytic murein transglycosylase
MTYIRMKNISASLLATAVYLAFISSPRANDIGLRTIDTTASIPELSKQRSGALQNFPEASTLKAIAEAYRKGELASGDALSRSINDTGMRVTAEWIAIRTSARSVGFERLNHFLSNNPDVPMRKWLLRKAEDALFLERANASKTLAFFGTRAPEGVSGKTILALAKAAKGETVHANALALEAYRDKSTTRDIAELLAKTFPSTIMASEQTLRAHRLILNNQRAEGLRIAVTLGTDQLVLAQALASAATKGEVQQPFDVVVPALKTHSSYQLGMTQILRRQNKVAAARDMMNLTTHDPALLADADEWWTERRLLARKLLDANDAAGAYRVVAEHSAQSIGRRAEAEFHAGWIALQYLKYPQTALVHFNQSAQLAELITAKSRAAYWQGRAIDAGALDSGAVGSSKSAYEKASMFPATYYGQLAAHKLEKPAFNLPVVEASHADETLFAASLAGQMIDHLLSANLADLAAPLAIDYARTALSASQVDAAAQRFVALNDAPTVLAIGRAATARGLALEQHAFPVFGIPGYQALSGSGEKAMVYAIARQESAFQTKAVSHANARGLMQMLPSTASRTAQRFKVPFHPNRLTEEPAFNAMLGAAHLGELMEETKGSLVMTFASYNAGGGRVREWVQAYGDPRKPGVDVVDWIERIPFYETRNYVQRIMENLQVYRARLGNNRSALLIDQDMERGRRP